MKITRKHVLLFGAFATALGALLILVASWLIGSTLLAPAPSIPSGDLPGLRVEFASDSGSTLRGNLIRGSAGRGAVILMHGVRGNRSAMAGHAGFLAKEGFSVLYFDFQAHGESPGKKITNGYLESRDATAAVAFLKKQLPGEKIGVLGVSLGGAAALLAEPPLDVDGMVLEMVYPDLERAVKNRIALVAGDWARPFSPFLTWQNKWRIGVNTDWFSPERAISEVRCPKLIIAGKNDRHTTMTDSEALFNAAVEPKEFWVVEGAGHENLRTIAGSKYERRLLDFFIACLKR